MVLDEGQDVERTHKDQQQIQKLYQKNDSGDEQGLF